MASPIDFGKVVKIASSVNTSGPVTEEILDGMEQSDVATTINYLMSVRDRNADETNRAALRRSFLFVWFSGIATGVLATLLIVGIWFNPIRALTEKLDQASAARAILDAVRKGQ